MEEKKERKILIAFMLMMKMEWKRKKNSPLKTNLRFSYAILGERGNHSQREWIIAHELSIMILPFECVSPISNKFFSQLFYASNFMNNSMYYVCVCVNIPYQYQQHFICGFQLSIFNRFMYIIWHNFNPLLSRAALLYSHTHSHDEQERIYCEWDKENLSLCIMSHTVHWTQCLQVIFILNVLDMAMENNPNTEKEEIEN